MPYTIMTGTLQSLKDRLDGAYLLTPLSSIGVPIGGMTLIFSQPEVGTVTFSGALNAMRTVAEIVSEINTGLTASPASQRGADSLNYSPARTYVEGRGMVMAKMLHIILQDDTNGITITGGTARTLLGIPSSTVTFTPTAQAKIVGFSPDATASHYMAFVAP